MTTSPPPPPGGPPPGGPPPGGPPPGGPPPGGPPPPGWTPPPPPGYANNDEKTWALVAHFGGIVVGFIAPLVAMLAKGNESATVRAHAVEALNFQITWNAVAVIAWIVATCTGFVLFFLPTLVWIFIVVMCILGGVKANEGTLWTYPAKIVLVK